MPNLTGRVVKSDWQLVHFTVYSEKFAIYSECYCLNSQHGSMSLCGLFVSKSGYSKSFEKPCINTSVKRLCMSERCNEKVTCFLMSHASYKQPHKPVSHGVLNAYNLFLV